jgi:tripeptide aminopeptidase
MDEVTDLFCKLVAIPSPSGKELEVGTFIQKILKESGIQADFDNSGSLNNSNSGNLIVRLKGEKPQTLLFTAHVDTVETGEKAIVPHVDGGIIKSDGTTILGADDKGSVAPLIEALKELSKTDDRPSIVAAFTTREEDGKMGASVLDLTDTIDFAFVLDGGEPIGSIVYQTLGEVPFNLTITGKATHAASAPEKGINAMTAAATIITKLPIGKTEDGKVLNIGKIKGGTGNNVVPDLVEMEGQARAFSQTEIDAIFIEMEKTIKAVCDETGCTFQLIKNVDGSVPPSSLQQDHPIIKIAQRSVEAVQIPFLLEKGSFCTEANFLGVRYPTITIKRGSKNAHSFEESISIEGLNTSKKLIVSLVNNSFPPRD